MHTYNTQGDLIQTRNSLDYLHRLNIGVIDVKISIVISIIFLALLVYLYSTLFLYRFEVVNDAGRSLEDFHIYFADVDERRERLASGEIFIFYPFPNTSGGIIISYTDGETRVERKLGYVARLASIRCKFQIKSDDVYGGCEY